MDSLKSYRPNLSSELREDNRNPYAPGHDAKYGVADWMRDTAGVGKEQAIFAGVDLERKAEGAVEGIQQAAANPTELAGGVGKTGTDPTTPLGMLRRACEEAQIAQGDEYAYEGAIGGFLKSY